VRAGELRHTGVERPDPVLDVLLLAGGIDELSYLVAFARCEVAAFCVGGLVDSLVVAYKLRGTSRHSQILRLPFARSGWLGVHVCGR
jgi:hypothetical protein